MLNYLIKRVFITISLLMSLSGFSAPGRLFVITAIGEDTEPVPLDVCLSVGRRISVSGCGTASVTAMTFDLKTVAPNYTYSSAGVKIDSPLYSIVNCPRSINGFCIFQLSDAFSTIIYLRKAGPE